MKSQIEMLINIEQAKVEKADIYLEKANIQNPAHYMCKAKEKAEAKIEAYREVLTLIK